ncbi:MAG: hypothetical protein U5K31_05390 [Balneolaceae bacterium]|nr:hypothetical protein [Balneolaceae bacterium]
MKMLISDFYHVPTEYALGFIALTLTAAVIISIYFPKEDDPVHGRTCRMRSKPGHEPARKYDR